MPQNNDDKPKENEGIGFVTAVVTLGYAALFIGGGILTLLDKKRGKGR